MISETLIDFRSAIVDSYYPDSLSVVPNGEITDQALNPFRAPDCV